MDFVWPTPVHVLKIIILRKTLPVGKYSKNKLKSYQSHPGLRYLTESQTTARPFLYVVLLLEKKIAGLKPPLLAIKKQQVEALIRVKRCKGYSKQEKYRKRVIAYFFY